MSDKPEVPQDLQDFESKVRESIRRNNCWMYLDPNFLMTLIERIGCAEGRASELEAENLALSVRSDPVDQLRADVSVLSERNRRLESDLSALRGKVESATEIMAEIVRIDDQGDSPRWDWWAPKMRELLAARAAEGGTHGK